MEIIIKATQFFLSLSLLIVLHELGHFIPAKLFKTKVEKFYLFFDYKFSLLKKKIGGTEYGIGWIPLGGYVKIAGMIDESMDTEQLQREPQPWEFRSKPAWQRLIIMLGGVIVNFILGFLIYIMITWVWGIDYTKSNDMKNGFAVDNVFKKIGFKDGDQIVKINGVEPENVLDINKLLLLRKISTVDVLHNNNRIESLTIPSSIGNQIWESGNMQPFMPRFSAVLDRVLDTMPAGKAGLLKGDIITSVNGKPIQFWDEFTSSIKSSEGAVTLGLTRASNQLSITLNPTKDRTIGVGPKNTIAESINIRHKDYTFAESITKGSSVAYWTFKDYIAQFKYVFTKKGATQIGGFISIANIFPPKWDWKIFWSFTAMLSIMLGVMNLLPIPALDGGHVVFTLWEMITGKKPGDKFMEYAQMTGILILLALMILANGNDIVKLFS